MSSQQYDRWSLSLGRWGGLTVRLHIAYLLFIVVTLYLSSLGTKGGDSGIGWRAIAVLTVSVFVHELAHLLMIRRLGGTCDSVVLWPFGGVASNYAWSTPRKGLCAVLAGPAANLLLGLVCLVLLSWTDGEPILKRLAVLNPPDLTGRGLDGVLAMAFWINWLLFLVNLIPAYPFDGDQGLYYLLAAFWPETEERQLRAVVGWLARVFAVGLLLLAVASSYDEQAERFLWVPLALLGIFVFFSAGQAGAEEPRGQSTSVDPLAPPESDLEGETLPADQRGPLGRWLDERRAAALLRRERIEADEEQLVDEILARLHESGADSLSREDRAILKRVSARYRDRQNSR